MDGLDYDLAELLHHWGDAYSILRTDSGFLAQRRDDRATVTAPTADEMHAAILRDYTTRPVPR